jgi:hypothetical protein
MLKRFRTSSNVNPFFLIRFSKEPMMNGSQIPIVPCVPTQFSEALPKHLRCINGNAF